MQLLCPHSMTFDGSALRVFWFGFDHYSDYAPSYTIEVADISHMQRSNKQKTFIHLIYKIKTTHPYRLASSLSPGMGQT